MDEVRQALVWLHNNGNLSDSEFSVLSNFYDNDKRNIESIKNELRSFYQSKKAVLDKVSSINSINDEIEIIDIDEPINEMKVNLSSVSDLVLEGKNYIKMNYEDGSVRIIENNLDLPGEILFSRLMEKYSGERYDVTTLFQDMIKNCIEVKLYNFNDITNKNIYNQLSQQEKQDIHIVRSTYPDKQVISGPNDNIYIVRETGKEDLFVSVYKKDGIYQVRPINELTYNSMSNENGSNDISESKSIGGQQKTLGAHPSTGKAFSWSDKEAGFMNILFSIFFSGIGIGIVFMTFLNLFVK